MTDQNYTPDEVRLLDEFAVAAIRYHQEFSPDDAFAKLAYRDAAAMIAERRKRVPRSEGDLDDLVRGSLQCFLCKGVLAPEHYIINRPQQGGLRHFDCTDPEAKQYANLPAPVAQPQPEQAGELTEEAVEDWHQSALDEEGDISRAVALMRDGLHYKQECDTSAYRAEHWKRQAEQAEKERDEARRELGLEKQTVENLLSRMATNSASFREWVDRANNAEKHLVEAVADLERERMRLAACGVLAGCNTEDSLAKNLAMHPDYMSSSAQSVADAMRREMALRARAERAEKAEAAFRDVLCRWDRQEVSAYFMHQLTEEALAAHPAPKAEGGAS